MEGAVVIQADVVLDFQQLTFSIDSWFQLGFDEVMDQPYTPQFFQAYKKDIRKDIMAARPAHTFENVPEEYMGDVANFVSVMRFAVTKSSGALSTKSFKEMKGERIFSESILYTYQYLQTLPDDSNKKKAIAWFRKVFSNIDNIMPKGGGGSGLTRLGKLARKLNIDKTDINQVQDNVQKASMKQLERARRVYTKASKKHKDKDIQEMLTLIKRTIMKPKAFRSRVKRVLS